MSSASTTSSLLRLGPSSRLQDAPLPPPATLVKTSISEDSVIATAKRRHRRTRCCCCCSAATSDASLDSASVTMTTRRSCADLDIHGARYCLSERDNPGTTCTSSVQRSVYSALASCLINAQPLPAHCPAADDNSFIGCTSHDLTDDWSLASTHFGACFSVRSFIEPDVLKTMYRSTIPLRFI